MQSAGGRGWGTPLCQAAGAAPGSRQRPAACAGRSQPEPRRRRGWHDPQRQARCGHFGWEPAAQKPHRQLVPGKQQWPARELHVLSSSCWGSKDCIMTCRPSSGCCRHAGLEAAKGRHLSSAQLTICGLGGALGRARPGCRGRRRVHSSVLLLIFPCQGGWRGLRGRQQLPCWACCTCVCHIGHGLAPVLTGPTQHSGHPLRLLPHRAQTRNASRHGSVHTWGGRGGCAPLVLPGACASRVLRTLQGLSSAGMALAAVPLACCAQAGQLPGRPRPPCCSGDSLLEGSARSLAPACLAGAAGPGCMHAILQRQRTTFAHPMQPVCSVPRQSPSLLSTRRTQAARASPHPNRCPQLTPEPPQFLKFDPLHVVQRGRARASSSDEKPARALSAYASPPSSHRKKASPDLPSCMWKPASVSAHSRSPIR